MQYFTERNVDIAAILELSRVILNLEDDRRTDQDLLKYAEADKSKLQDEIARLNKTLNAWKREPNQLEEAREMIKKHEQERGKLIELIEAEKKRAEQWKASQLATTETLVKRDEAIEQWKAKVEELRSDLKNTNDNWEEDYNAMRDQWVKERARANKAKRELGKLKKRLPTSKK